jgi:hypothetical protein
MVGQSQTLLSRKIGLRLAERLDWPASRIDPLRAQHARADAALAQTLKFSADRGPYACAAVRPLTQHLLAMGRLGEWKALLRAEEQQRQQR